MKQECHVKRADWVTVEGSFLVGCVRRVSRNGSWAVVDWGICVKRMQTRFLQVQTTVQMGEWEVTDMTRACELGGEYV